MSRCFPFPPPGYEKKARIEDTDLLTKEKHKEKKHKKDKKDKKDKDKREGSKEKKNKDKERSKEKHSDKKDRKEKHKDKKDTDKEKDKNQTSDAKRIGGQPGCNNGDKLGPSNLQNSENSGSKYVQDLARRIRNDDRATGSQIGQKIIVTDPRRGELPGRTVEHSIGSRLEEKEEANDRKVNGQRNHVEVRSSGNAIVPGFPSVDQKRFQGIAKPVEKNDFGKKVEKDKNRHKENNNMDGKQKDRDRENKSRSKDKNRDKEKKKEEKAKEVTETNKDQIKLKDSSPKLKDSSTKLKNNGKGFLNSCNTKPLDVLKTSSNNPAGEGNLGKRKELEINGISHDNGIRPNKLPRPVSSSHQVMENGRKLEPCHTAGHLESKGQGGVHSRKVDMKEHKSNGLMEVQKPIVCSSGPLLTKARIIENGEASVKPPHPDSKYLNQILSVPKLEDCFDDFDNQVWLFNSDCVQSKKPKVGSPEVGGTQVWAEALQIESADVTVLPYVIPF